MPLACRAPVLLSFAALCCPLSSLSNNYQSEAVFLDETAQEMVADSSTDHQWKLRSYEF